MFDETQCSVAAGMLWGGASSRALRFVPVVASGDVAQAEAESQAVFAAAAAYEQQGYAVIVLDGTEAEHAHHNPGLQQLLHSAHNYGQRGLPVDTHTGSIATLPAAVGLELVADHAQSLGAHPLSLLWAYLRQHAVVIVYAEAHTIAPLMADCEAACIQFLPPAGRSTAAAYQAMRHLYQVTSQMPHLVALRQSEGFDPMLKNLSQMALEKLHAEPLAEQLDPSQPRQLRRWAMQSLEAAQCVYPPNYEPPIAVDTSERVPSAPVRTPSHARAAQGSPSSERDPIAAAAMLDMQATFAAARQRMAAAASARSH